MSIDLNVCISRKFRFNELMILTQEILMKLLNTEEVPDIRISRVEKGKVHLIDGDTTAEANSMYLLGYEGRDDQIGIVIIPDDDPKCGYSVCFSVGGTRSAEEFTLGLASAIALGKMFNSKIEDQQLFWTDEIELESNSLLERMKIKVNEKNDFSEACKIFLGTRLD